MTEDMLLEQQAAMAALGTATAANSSVCSCLGLLPCSHSCMASGLELNCMWPHVRYALQCVREEGVPLHAWGLS